MAKASREFTHSNRSVPPVEQQRVIAEKTAAFLAGGGQIQQIPKGVSGYPKPGSPHAPAAGRPAAIPVRVKTDP